MLAFLLLGTPPGGVARVVYLNQGFTWGSGSRVGPVFTFVRRGPLGWCKDAEEQGLDQQPPKTCKVYHTHQHLCTHWPGKYAAGISEDMLRIC